jgi:hypothetical protein
MKKVTKILMVVVLATFGFNSFAQTFGVQAGLNMANLAIKSGGDKVTDGKKMLLGFNAGVTAEFDISDVFAFQTGLILNQKGFKLENSYTEQGVSVDTKTKMSVMVLDIPLNAKYKMDLGGNTLYFAAGPYIGIGLSGKAKVEASAAGFSQETEDDIKFGSEEGSYNDQTGEYTEGDDMKRLDFGINVGAGLEFGAFGVGVQYGLGLANLVPGGDSDNSMKNRLLSIGLSYKFGK